jgi:hypothetical protein
MQRPGSKDRARPAESRGSGDSRKPYRTPTLAVHGSVKALTKQKLGDKGDGSGKPRSRPTGANPS